ncbi:MAG: chromosomal replication initiator protein DnaA, partial [Thiovulaceae bacterium]|nr:chromosomal replication initiator protein DnaA [Sulfurimonadaceae bacterium]
MNIGKTILKLLKDEISEIDYERYIKQIDFCTENSKSDLARFLAPNMLVANWVKTKY